MYAEKQKAKNGGNLTQQQKLILEIYIAVTGYILSDAIDVIRHGDKDNVNVYFLFGFAGGNFLVDIVSSYMFYWKGHEVLFTSIVSQDRQSVEHDNGLNKHQEASGSLQKFTIPNLNMISALTHVGSDTMRTTSVFIAAIISQVGGYDAAICDAWAAVVVSFTILLAIVPLSKEIYHAYYRMEEELIDYVMDDDTNHPTTASGPSQHNPVHPMEQSV